MIRIAVTGPESTGKSILAEKLATHFQTRWVPEFARKYLENTQGKYDYDDILAIAKGQNNAEIESLKTAGDLLICDTEFAVTYIWSEVKFKKVAPWIASMLETHTYDLYLLCNIDIPWEFDPLREHPGLRTWLFNRYEALLRQYKLNYQIVSGTGENRFNNALELVLKEFPLLGHASTTDLITG